jgi:pimeloyl-ACP methyl ester carboxylesterase
MKIFRYSIIVALLLISFLYGSVSVHAEVRNPVIIIPGIVGSWNPDVFLLNGSGGNWSFVPSDHTYDNLIKAFEDKGYVKDQNLFVAFYDWRENNNLSAQTYLIPVIDEALAHSSSTKVDIVAHSMGGLVARSYIEGPNYRNDVENLVMLGTPNLGASEAYPLWEGGLVPDSWGLIERNLAKTYILYSTLITPNSKSSFDIIHNSIPSIKELLPVYDFLYNSSEDEYRSISSMNEQNSFLLNLNDSIKTLKELGSLTTIAGGSRDTLDVIPYGDRTNSDAELWIDGQPNPLPPIAEDNNGDGTVLSWSALIPKGQLYPPVLAKNPIQKMFSSLFPVVYAEENEIPITAKTIDSTHLDLPTKAIPDIFEAIGLTPSSETYQPISGPDEVLTYLFASPVAVKVIDPTGASITSTSSTISGAFYSGVSDPNGPKVVFITNPIKGVYKVELTGTEDGHYHMAVLDEADATSTEEVVEKDITQGEKITYTINFNPQSSTSTTVISAPEEVGATSTPTTTPIVKTAKDLTQELINDVAADKTSGKITSSVHKTLSRSLSNAFKALSNADALTAKQNSRFPLLNRVAIRALDEVAKLAIEKFEHDVKRFKEKGIDITIVSDLLDRADEIITAIK